MKAKSKSMRSMGYAFVYLLLLGFGMFFLSGCGNSQSTGVQDPPKVTNQENTSGTQNATGVIPATANLTADEVEAAVGANTGVQLVDIREPREFAAGHIKMAINRPLGELETKITQISKDKEIILVDLNGIRAEAAWQILVNNGYDQSKIKVLTGGMLEWNGIVSSAGNNSGGENGATGAAAPKPQVQEMVGGC